MEFKELLLILLSSFQAVTVLALAGLAWMHKQQVGRMVDATRYQASALKEHVEVTTTLMERLDAHTTTSTHMSMMMSKGIDATLELAKANQRLVRTLEGGTNYDIPSIEKRNESATVSKATRDRKPAKAQGLKPGNGDIVRVPRRSPAEKAEETQPVVS